MSAGSVIVDLAAETGEYPYPHPHPAGYLGSSDEVESVIILTIALGGNCELTVPGEKIVTPNGVTIIGYTVRLFVPRPHPLETFLSS
jgi:NAD/NADP transhydrogenase alpha subunit